MEKEQKLDLIRIIISAVLLGAAYLIARLVPMPWWGELLMFLVPYLIAGLGVLKEAGENILHGEIFDENFLMAVATIGALAIGEYPEAVFVMIFYQVGELFEDCAVDKSRDSIAKLMDIRPDVAHVERDGETADVDPREVAVGEVILVRPGERLPLDGVVLEGTSSLDTAALTGETLPRDTAPGAEVISGCVNLTGLLKLRVTKVYGESTVAKILDLVENAGAKKAKAENFITKFARYYTPAVCGAAVLLAVLPPLMGLGAWSFWLHQALTFLVISCPCALVISVPLSFFGGIGGASRRGILIKGGSYLEALSKAHTVVFDKTGTLTQGVFEVTALHPQACGEEELLELAALCERYSDHPISKSLRAAWGKEPEAGRLSEVTERAGHGVRARVDGAAVWVGNEALMEEAGVAFRPCHTIGTTVHVAREGKYLGHIVISDRPKEDSAAAVSALHGLGAQRTVMLTGDSPQVGEAVGAELGIREVHAGLLPGDKVDWVERLLAEKPEKGSLLFVGDGVNDAPVLARADVGIAMGGLGSDAAIEAADVVIMDDRPGKVALGVKLARRTMKIVRENIVFALGVKAVILALGVLGYGSMWLAAFADVGVSVLAILNALRCLYGGKKLAI